MRRVHVGPVIIIISLDFDIEFFLSMKIMDYSKDNNPRRGSRKQGGSEAEAGSFSTGLEGANTIAQHLE